MKLLLIDPPELFLRGQGHTRQVQPLGLAHVGAAVADLVEVRFLLPDTRPFTGTDPWAELVTTVAAEAPDLIGFTAVTATFPSAARFAAELRREMPDLPIVLGGVHASTDPRGALLGAPDIDWVIRGEGEFAMRDLVVALQEAGGGRQLACKAEIAGLWWRDERGEIKQAPPRLPTSDLDQLPLPLREGLVWPDHIEPTFYQAMVTLRGCPYKCIYCAVPGLDERKTRYRSPTHVVDEIAHLKQRFNIPYLFFHDSVFTLHKKRTLAICKQMIERGLQVPFCIQTRADRLDEELLDALVAAGLHQVFFGIESGDAGSLRKIRKATPLATIRRAVALTRQANVRTSGFFMVGWPWEDRALMDQTAEFATSLDLDAVSLFSATPLPGTELWDLANGPSLPESIDFRRPQVNLTQLSDEAYGVAFAGVKARIDAYNQERMLANLPEDVRLAWMNLPEKSAR
ncbi:MAG: cobalamin-dependent protein [Myxococcales bacterium]|nr:cobalamin-dependent protein [Myxococcales bacterium]